jgi:hypothetical protein
VKSARPRAEANSDLSAMRNTSHSIDNLLVHPGVRFIEQLLRVFLKFLSELLFEDPREFLG